MTTPIVAERYTNSNTDNTDNAGNTGNAKEDAIHWRNLARQYHAYGFNVVPLGADKRPVVSGVSRTSGAPLRFRWEDWQTTKQQGKLFNEMLQPAWWADVRGVAGICGPVSGNLVCIDFDKFPDDTALKTMLAAFGLPDDYGWCARTPGNGWHIWIRVLDASSAVQKEVRNWPGVPVEALVEYRYTDHYTALPGSHHPSGGVYKWRNGAAPTEPPTLVDGDALAIYRSVTDEQPSSTKQPASSARPAEHSQPAAQNGDYAVYVARALEDECNAVRNATSHRNDRLNQAAFSLGTLIGAGVLDRQNAESELTQVAIACGLTEKETTATIRSGIEAGIKQPRRLPHPETRRQWAAGDDADGDGDQPGRHNPWPYGVEDGRIVYFTEGEDDIRRTPIADFQARIIAESEHVGSDKRTYTIAGCGIRGGVWQCTIDAEEFADANRLGRVLSSAAGALDTIHTGQAKHLPAALKRLTSDVERLRTHHRTGWYDGRFIIDGNLENGETMALPDRLSSYAIGDADADATTGVKVLRDLITAMTAERGAVMVAHMLAAPLARLARLDTRLALAIIGRTGSKKTTCTALALSIYGAGWTKPDALLGWGQGATGNAILDMASAASDMPYLIDNYKPNTGNGERDFVNVIHAILEGQTKARMTRAGEMRSSKIINCWPVVTGEDVPTRDAASLARVILLTWPENGVNTTQLTAVQRRRSELQNVGGAWIRWLSSAEGQKTATSAGSALEAKRFEWHKYITQHTPNAANPDRVATNLATLEIAWRTAMQCPALAPLAVHTTALMGGLQSAAAEMASQTADSREVERFLTHLRSALATGALQLASGVDVVPDSRQRIVGWLGSAKATSGAYLTPENALQAVRSYSGDELGHISVQMLGKQLQAGGYLVPNRDGNVRTQVRFSVRTLRVWHITDDALNGDDAAGDDAAGDDGELARIAAVLAV